MQFQYNSDYPGVSGNSTGPDGVVFPAVVADPTAFPPAQPIPCARITTRIFHPLRNEISTVQNVLVRTMMRPSPSQDDSNSSMSSDDFSCTSSSSDQAMQTEGNNNSNKNNTQQQLPRQLIQLQPPPGIPLVATAFEPTNHPYDDPGEPERAYWIQRTLREAIYGRVLFATVLRRRRPNPQYPNNQQMMAAQNPINADWEVTAEFVAIKEMSQDLIRKERDRLAEDPIKEVSAMQYLKQWHDQTMRQPSSKQAFLETHVMMPLDLLSDDRNMYSVMPYCDGGELFERLDLNERFSEEEARYWMHQVLTGLESLQSAGVCHRDLSLENLLVHQNGALIIDLGMCLRIPYRNDNTSMLSAAFSGMNMNGAVPINTPENMIFNGRVAPRCLIRPQGTCGKWIYMSPEIYLNQEPFDGFAVDIWAAGVILFLMLTGFPPWERACASDERFKYMTAGYLVQMLTEWELGLSSDAMDLLQRMLFLDPKDRLSLDQVRAHPWMVNGRSEPPSNAGVFR